MLGILVGLVYIAYSYITDESPRPVFMSVQEAAEKQCAKFGHTNPHYRATAGGTSGVIFRSASFRKEFYCMSKDGVSVPVQEPACTAYAPGGPACVVAWKKHE